MKTMRLALAAAIMSVGLGASASASARPLNFTLTDGGSTYSFSLDSNPPPFVFSSNDFSFISDGTLIHEFGDPTKGYATFVYDAFGNNGPSQSFYGPSKIFSGPGTNPVFSPGTFTLRNGATGTTASLSIAAAPGAPAPEVGVGLLSALAAFAALALTRFRKPRSALVPA